ncbi:hypothetical protein COV13_03510 [Candidatus Woesearchaeota archaeon CG10_big_fil_rev_8_21_14_0_10_32_9]|nr:MAG: hypothetical protein COV13_03510 [Candidatus Woesearchaeota archaeon CG10_big_fil_rev_8_21_14_0_10_32_9]
MLEVTKMMNDENKIWMGIVLLVFGVLFLLQNLNVWNIWGIQWYTVAFVLLGLSKLCKGKKK